jgi:hypothetical protein
MDFNENWADKSDQSIQFLLDRGYDCLRIAENGLTAACTREQVHGVENLLFVDTSNRDRIEHLAGG